MSNESIFSDNDQTPEDTTPVAVVIPDQLKDLIGPGKKYATLEKALESIPHAQNHIQTLESEMRDLKTKVATVTPTEDVLKTVQEYLAQDRATHGTPGLDVDALESLLDRKLTEREQRAVEAQNRETVDAAMQERYGDKAKEMFKAKAVELGVGVDFLTSVIAKSGKAGMELLGLSDKKQTTPSSSRGSLNTAALQYREKQPDPPKKLMTGGAKASDVVAEWRRHDPTKQE